RPVLEDGHRSGPILTRWRIVGVNGFGGDERVMPRAFEQLRGHPHHPGDVAAGVEHAVPLPPLEAGQAAVTIAVDLLDAIERIRVAGTPIEQGHLVSSSQRERHEALPDQPRPAEHENPHGDITVSDGRRPAVEPTERGDRSWASVWRPSVAWAGSRTGSRRAGIRCSNDSQSSTPWRTRKAPSRRIPRNSWRWGSPSAETARTASPII